MADMGRVAEEVVATEEVVAEVEVKGEVVKVGVVRGGTLAAKEVLLAMPAESQAATMGSGARSEVALEVAGEVSEVDGAAALVVGKEAVFLAAVARGG